MNNTDTLEQLRQCFIEVIPKADARTIIPPLEFVINIIFCFLGDTECTSLESIRRYMKNQTEKKSSRGSFWERLASNRLKTLLRAAVSKLLTQLSTTVIGPRGLLKQLGIIGIEIVDSCIFTLWDGASDDFPGVKTNAGIKLHSCFNPLTGKFSWFDMTPSSTHDRKCFPDLQSLIGKLVIVDLGYWDFCLLWAIDNIGGFFLSRIKSKTVIYITEFVQANFSKKHLGKSLFSLPLKRKRGDIIEIKVEKECKSGILACRAIAFWNPAYNCYHWYITNLKVAPHLIYPLYRLRWQIELVFKACKQSLNANRLTSNNSNIIESLLLASIAAHLASQTILNVAIPELTKIEQLAISVQRVAKVAVSIASDFIKFLVTGSSNNAKILLNKILLFADEIFDPNYRHRETSLARTVYWRSFPKNPEHL